MPLFQTVYRLFQSPVITLALIFMAGYWLGNNGEIGLFWNIVRKAAWLFSFLALYVYVYVGLICARFWALVGAIPRCVRNNLRGCRRWLFYAVMAVLWPAYFAYNVLTNAGMLPPREDQRNLKLLRECISDWSKYVVQHNIDSSGRRIITTLCLGTDDIMAVEQEAWAFWYRQGKKVVRYHKPIVTAVFEAYREES